MSAKRAKVIPVVLVLCILLVEPRTNMASQGGRRNERLGPRTDVNDAEIIRMLDEPLRSMSAMGLISYRKVSAAVPDLLYVLRDERRMMPERFMAATTLCNLGNTDWIKPIKEMSADPNSELSRAHGVDVAGLLARAGDYSRFDIVAGHLKDREGHTQVNAVSALANFAHGTHPAAISAAGLLCAVATSDPDPWMREHAIWCLEKIVQKRPDAEAKLIEAARANAHATDRSLWNTSQALLMMYKQKPPAEKQDAPK